VSRLDQREDGEIIQEYLRQKTGQRTVPNIFISQYMYILLDYEHMLTVVLQTRSISAAPMTSLLPKPPANLPSLSRRKNLGSFNYFTVSNPAPVPRRIYNHPRLEWSTISRGIHATNHLRHHPFFALTRCCTAVYFTWDSRVSKGSSAEIVL